MNARSLQLLSVSLLALAWAGQAARADDYPTQALGIEPQKAYQFGAVDHVNLFDGNLVLSIAIGQRYPVGASFSYGLDLVYNSNVWDYVDTSSGQGLTTAFPKRNSNAGMGWLLTLGLLQEPNDPDNTTGVWLYVGSDGAEHRLYPSLHNEEPAVGARQYMRDGSYIRMRGTNTDSAVYLDFPDGTTHTFTKYGSFDWRITGISDPFGNGVGISYQNYPSNWLITDSLGRQTTVWLEPTTTCPASWSCYQYRVRSVVVPTFNQSSATYSFNYQDQSVTRACPSNDPAFGSSFNQSFLVSVTLADGSSWGMPAGAYITTTSNCKTYGQLTDLVLPTLGQLQWTYGNYTFPTDDGGGRHPWRTSSPGVTVRSELTASGSVLGSWIYTPSLTSYPPDRTHPLEAVRLVQTPLNHTTVNYFSVAQSLGLPPAPWSVAEYGLPLTHNQTDPYTGYPLSTQTYPCVVTNPASPPCGVMRSTYLAYATDTNQGGDVTGQTHLDQRVSNRRVVYNDDSNLSTGYVYSNFDGLGHYRQADLSGNFTSGGNALTTVTDFNPGNGTYPGSFVLPDVNGPWVLGTYDYQTRQQGSLAAKIETCFAPNTGFVLRKRLLQYGTSEGPHDLLTVFTPGSTGTSRGNVVTEDYFGGDTQNLSGLCGSTCACSLGTGQYRINKTYPSGTLATSQYLGAPFYSLNRTIDANTGLPSASQDSSFLTTTYGYDPMGRIQSISPPGQLTTRFTYTPATPSAQAKVDITTDSDATHGSLLFDDLGRVTEESRLDPAGYNFRQTLYDAAGNQASVSEWGSFANKTQYRYYDPFGRPQQVQSPDGHLAQLTYYGVREVDRTVSIAVAGGERGETTREIYDAQGRLQQVQEPAGGTVTTYGYDVGDRLSSVTSTGSGATQTRSFSYDNRGFLLSEQQPEKGPNGNGAVTHGGYDPLGHEGNVIDSPNNLNLSYDAAGRLVLVADGNNANRTLKVFSYSASNGSGGSGFSLGKLLQSSRYNYITASGNPVTVEIRHNYLYGDGSVTQNVGRVTNRTTRFFVNGGASAAETYSQTFSYDSLGNVQALGYPQCIAGGCGGASGANSVTFNYGRNLLTSVSGYADAITYSPSRQVAQVQHHNGLTDTIAPDPNFMLRPGSISTALTSNPSTLYWSTGAYAYDGEGNIKSIGAASFVYEPVSRLTSSTLYTDPVTPTNAVTQSTSFDAFGNVQSITTNGVTINTPTSSTTNRLNAPTTYDAAGNVTGWNGQTYVFDAFNQMIRFCASGCGSGEDWTYMYDADDERTWLFKNYQYHFRRTLRDLGGKVLRDYFTSATTSAVEDYVYRDGQLLGAQITQNGVAQPTRHFSLDHLDTPRLITTSPGAGSGFYTLTPCRILDTRQTGVPLTQTNPQQVYQISGVCGVPANAVAVAFNVTLVGATTKLWVQGYPGDLAPPGTNVVSATPPNTSTIAGFAVLPLATNGSGTLGVLMTLTPPATSGQTDLILDVTGYFAPTSAASVVAYHAYFPDGLEATYFAQDSERMKFTGHERDLGDPSSPADDLDYMHARHYSMLTGRFLSVDPLEGDPIAPQSFNLYGYVGNQPLTVTDQAGLSGTPVGEAPDFYYLYGDTVNAVTGSWQFAPGANTGLWGLGALQAGSLQFQNGFGAGGGPVELGLMDRILSSIPIQSNKYGECVREHRARPEKALLAIGSAVPKALVPPFRVIYQSDPLTTPGSVGAFAIKRVFQGSEAAGAFAAGFRAGAGAASWVLTPLTVIEGGWDWGALVGCAVNQ
jgi:RHS repeat-associated protein